MRELDFLSEPSDARLQKEIRNISDSYSHPWDPLAELCQNAVDAIRKHIKLYGAAGQPQHRISIEVNSRERRVVVSDTGVGIPLEDASALLAPSGTSKGSDPELIGEKGVGLTYTIFTCNLYQMESKSETGRFKAEITDAANWKVGISADKPMLRFVEEETTPQPCESLGTSVRLTAIEPAADGDEDLFTYDYKQLAYVLRTKTAVGDTAELFGGTQPNISVSLKVISALGRVLEGTIPFTYCTPEEAITPGNVIEFKDFLARAALMSDAQKGTALKGKAIRIQGSIVRSGRSLKYYGLFAPTRRLWREIGARLGAEQASDDPEAKSMVEGGILVSTKGMPTGIVLEPPQSGSAGYWPNFYIVVEDDAIVFDVGRKYVPSRTKGVLKDVAKEEIFEKVRPIIHYATSDPRTETPPINALQQAQRAKEFERLQGLPDLGVTAIPFMKHPARQEGAISAIFHELVGAGVLKGYRPLATGYKSTYDLWGIYSVEREHIGSHYHSKLDAAGYLTMAFVLEFKYSAESILVDWATDTKYYSDVDLIVCWDFDEEKLAKAAVTVRPLQSSEVLFHGSNFQLEFASSYNLGSAGNKPVLALRHYLDRVKAQGS